MSSMSLSEYVASLCALVRTQHLSSLGGEASLSDCDIYEVNYVPMAPVIE